VLVIILGPHYSVLFSAKVISGPIWEGRLGEFFDRFAKRRTEFQFALTIHTARGVDEANAALANLQEASKAIDAKMDQMLKIFHSLVSPEQQQMAQLIERKGGIVNVQGNVQVLKELNTYEQKNFSTGAPPIGNVLKSGGKDEVSELLEEIRTSPEDAIQNNMAIFERKYEMQHRQLLEEVTRAIRREGDRIISVITAGPHDRIIDSVSLSYFICT